MKILSISFLAFFCLAACSHDVEYTINKKDSDYADLYTNKDAYSIYYYKQPVTGDANLAAWERDVDSDAKETYVPAGSSVSSLNNKAYEGFVFAGIIQNDTTINVYYKRCTICYEFYDKYGDETALFKIQGLYGMHSIKPICQDKEESYFDSWYTKNQVPYGTTFYINADSNTVDNISTTKWYASWTGKNSVLGLSMNLVKPGDILLRDGSVMPAGDFDKMSTEQINAAVAVLLTNTYDPETGKNVDGTVRLIAGLKPGQGEWVDNDWKDSKNTNYLAFQGFQTSSTDGKSATETILTIDKEYRKNTSRENALLYSLDYDIHAGVSKNYRNEWYLPSRAELAFAQASDIASIYVSLNILPNGAECWTSSAEGDKVNTGTIHTDASANQTEAKYDINCYIIPFRQID